MSNGAEQIKNFTKVENILHYWNTAIGYLKAKDKENARDNFDICLIIAAKASEDGIKELAGVSVDLWKIRSWVKLENNGLLM